MSGRGYPGCQAGDRKYVWAKEDVLRFLKSWHRVCKWILYDVLIVGHIFCAACIMGRFCFYMLTGR